MSFICLQRRHIASVSGSDTYLLCSTPQQQHVGRKDCSGVKHMRRLHGSHL